MPKTLTQLGVDRAGKPLRESTLQGYLLPLTFKKWPPGSTPGGHNFVVNVRLKLLYQ